MNINLVKRGLEVIQKVCFHWSGMIFVNYVRIISTTLCDKALSVPECVCQHDLTWQTHDSDSTLNLFECICLFVCFCVASILCSCCCETLCPIRDNKDSLNIFLSVSSPRDKIWHQTRIPRKLPGLWRQSVRIPLWTPHLWELQGNPNVCPFLILE